MVPRNLCFYSPLGDSKWGTTAVNQASLLGRCEAEGQGEAATCLSPGGQQRMGSSLGQASSPGSRLISWSASAGRQLTKHCACVDTSAPGGQAKALASRPAAHSWLGGFFGELLKHFLTQFPLTSNKVNMYLPHEIAAMTK